MKGKLKSKTGGDNSHLELFKDLKKSISNLDPVSFIENNLLINGYKFDLSTQGSGWKYMRDIYRSVATQAENKNSRPVVILKGRQVGATVMAAALSLFFAASGLYGKEAGKPPMRIMHLFPTLKLTAQHSKEKLDPMMIDSVDNYIARRALSADKKSKSSAEDTITEKSFLGYNKLRVDATGLNGDRIRGTSQDVIFFDEVQDMRRTAIENILPVVQASPYGASTQGVQLYFGTPKQSGSYFWELWRDSSKCFFELGCESCHGFFPLYNLDDDSWLDTWVSGFTVKCPHCSFHQDKRHAVDRGRWKETKVDGLVKYTGFHFNMMLSPLYTKEDVIKKYPPISGGSERAWKNEVLGDFYSGAGQPLTMEDIENFALDPDRGLAKAISSKNDKIICMGADWGDKDDTEGAGSGIGQSYSVIVITSIDRNGVITVENAFRLKKNDITYKVSVLKKLFETFRIGTAAADYMWGQDVVRWMQQEENLGSRFLAVINSGGATKDISYNSSNNKVIANKNMMIDEIFSMIRQGKIRFPAKGDAYEMLRWLREHCSSMEIETKIKDGNVVKSYQKGGTPNDGLMALMYAVIAYKYVITSGFKNKDVNVKHNSMPVPVLGYLPRM